MNGEIYDVYRGVYDPDSHPYIFYIILSPESLTAIGVLGKITKVFEEKGVPILHVTLSAPQRGHLLKIIIVADMNGREKLAEELARRLGEIPYVKEVRWAPPITPGNAIDVFSHPLTIHGSRAVMMREPVYRGLIKSGWERFGTAYAVLLYAAGYEAGLFSYKEHVKFAPEPDTGKLAAALFQMLGYGKLEFVKVDDEKREAIVRVYDSFECSLFPDAGEIRGNFVRGMIAGWLAGHWSLPGDEEAFAKEVKCIAKGDPYCEYHVRVEKKQG